MAGRNGPVFNKLCWKGRKLKKHILLIFCCVLLVLNSCNQDLTSSNSENKEITNIINKFHENFEKKEFQLLSALCTDDMFWYTLNGRAVPKSSLAGFFLPIMSSWKSAKTTLSDLDFKGDGKMVVVRYKSQIDILTSTGGQTMNNLHTCILKKTDVGWKIWQHHMSSK
jgi:ketosteroid isomerase-like protein